MQGKLTYMCEESCQTLRKYLKIIFKKVEINDSNQDE